MPRELATVREITSYPWRFNAVTADGTTIRVEVTHDEFTVTLGEETVRAAVDPLRVREAITPVYAE